MRVYFKGNIETSLHQFLNSSIPNNKTLQCVFILKETLKRLYILIPVFLFPLVSQRVLHLAFAWIILRLI